MTDSSATEDSDPASAQPFEALSQLFDGALRLSASMAQAVAEAASGQPQEHQPGDTYLQSMIRSGVLAGGSIAARVFDVARSANVSGQQAPAPPAAPMPILAAGDSLRIPLSVDNPSKTPMEDIVPFLIGMTHQGVAQEGPLQIAFSPEKLSVAPVDFEKLVVTVSAPASTPLGSWGIAFALSQSDDPINLSLSVVAAGEPS